MIETMVRSIQHTEKPKRQTVITMKVRVKGRKEVRKR